ncbi:hypothetical protein TraAM80_07267 [Trypanosoma rangeli]|uniref:Uncharacterized protein n=1 Tax=Trypanosoma rangeli TaxID=5698 RepID=A0A422N6A8_TRYRA|nr:uncharacterized protein TraAM80_07267 [Trypanosoma rangeli]RNF01024.1 hypothetical protein TraAM80_07267 [Trypanosoma rangeli]|eukprot:RNF01024.1 hypothetical protein TraAM80_07267 [Trypanosoma rangeli]
MSLLKADQVRRELFVTYSRQIAALLRETVDGDPIETRSEEANGGGDDDREEAKEQQHEEDAKEDRVVSLSERFRVSYARQHLLRQRALRLPKGYTEEVDGAYRTASSEAGDATTPAGEDVAAVMVPAETAEEAVEEEGWRLAYHEPYPSLRRIMRRVQDESLQTLLQESRVPVTAHRDEAYAAQRISALHQIEEQIGRERATILARQQKMDGKLHPMQ